VVVADGPVGGSVAFVVFDIEFVRGRNQLLLELCEVSSSSSAMELVIRDGFWTLELRDC